MPLTRTTTLGIRVDAIPATEISQLLDRPSATAMPVLFSFVNPASVTVAEQDVKYRRQLEAFHTVLPDGIGMCWAVRLLHGVEAARVSFDTTSLAPMVFRRAQRDGRTVALVGGRDGVAPRAAWQLAQAFPTLRIAAALDGYGDRTRKLRELSALAPDVVVCGMGAGAQEQFLIDLAESGWSGAGFTCGGYLDQLATGMNYYPRWVDVANLRWAYRLLREPKRLARRYGIDYGRFAVRLAGAMLAAGRRPDLQHEREA